MNLIFPVKLVHHHVISIKFVKSAPYDGADISRCTKNVKASIYNGTLHLFQLYLYNYAESIVQKKLPSVSCVRIYDVTKYRMTPYIKLLSSIVFLTIYTIHSENI